MRLRAPVQISQTRSVDASKDVSQKQRPCFRNLADITPDEEKTQTKMLFGTTMMLEPNAVNHVLSKHWIPNHELFCHVPA